LFTLEESDILFLNEKVNTVVEEYEIKEKVNF